MPSLGVSAGIRNENAYQLTMPFPRLGVSRRAAKSAFAYIQPPDDQVLPPGARAVASPVPGSVWKVLVSEGDTVVEGQSLAIVESMKMEFPVTAPCDGRVLQVRCQAGCGVTAGQDVVIASGCAAFG